MDHGSNSCLIILENFKKKQGFFLRLFPNKNPKGKFMLNQTTEIVGFSVFNKYNHEQQTTKKTL